MSRLPITLVAGVVLCMLMLAPAASARFIEVGKTGDAAPSCPAKPCYAISRTTGYQAKVGPDRSVYTMPADGKIVAFTISLGKPGKEQTAFFEKSYGGPASAGITILKPGKSLNYTVVSQSPIYALTPYFGTTVQIPLGTALNVKKGYVLALTVPTWAPALAVGLGNDTSWRASRAKGKCNDVQTLTTQRTLGGQFEYRCLYRTARLTYSATLVTNPDGGPAKVVTK